MTRLHFIIAIAFISSICTISAQTLIGPARPVSMPMVAGSSADGGSFAPVMSGDGHHVAFVSQSRNLVTNDDIRGFLDVFVKDLDDGTVTLASVSSPGHGGGNGDSSYPMISSNGQFVTFLSLASNLTANDTNSAWDVFQHDTFSGITTLASIGLSGKAGSGGSCLGIDVTPDGRYIAFSSTQTNLVTNSVPLTTNIYLRDMQSGTTEWVSVTNNSGTSAGSDFPSISADGQRIVFCSAATNLVSNSVPAGGQVYLRDRTSATTICVGTYAQPFITGAVHSTNIVLSSSGTAAAFVGINSNGVSDALIYYDVNQSLASLINTNVSTAFCPEISSDGRWVAYLSGTNGFVWDSQTGSNFLMNVDISGVATGSAYNLTISSDGHRAAFVSNGTNIVAGINGGVYQLYLRDLTTGAAQLASPNVSGGPGSGEETAAPSLSGDGSIAAFTSPDNTLAAGDLNHANDVFTWSWNTALTTLVSSREVLRPSSTDISFPISGAKSLSADGRYVAFSVMDGNQVAGDTNNLADVFLRDTVSGITLLASPDTNGQFATNAGALNPCISGDGHLVAFVRAGTIYLQNMQSGVLSLVSTNNIGVATTDASNPVLSSNGQYLLYQTSSGLASNDGNSKVDIYAYDINGKTNRIVSVGPGNTTTGYNSSNAVVSPDGRWVVFQSSSPNLVTPPLSTTSIQLYARDLVSNVTYNVSYAPNGTSFTGDNSNAAFSANSRYMAFVSATASAGNAICLHDFLTGSNQMISSNCIAASLNSDGTKIAYAGTNGQVFVMDRTTGLTNLVSVATNGVSTGNGKSYGPLLSADGRFVIFSSKASNLARNATNGLTAVYARDLVLSNTIVISAARAGAVQGLYPSVNPMLAADGRTVVFQSFGNDLVTNDFCQQRDLFMVRLGIGDSDGDGMDDDWEMTYFGNLSHDGSADTDGDGMTDLQEYFAGTYPTSNSSVLRCLTVMDMQAGAAVYWSAVPGRSYRIEYKNTLVDANWTTLVDALTANSATTMVLDKGASLAGQRFYRVSVLP